MRQFMLSEFLDGKKYAMVRQASPKGIDSYILLPPYAIHRLKKRLQTHCFTQLHNENTRVKIGKYNRLYFYRGSGQL